MIAITLAALTVVFLVTTGLLTYQVYAGSAEASQRTAALVAARQEATALTTLSKTTGASDWDAVLAGAAGDLKQQLTSTGKDAFLKTLKTANVSSVGTVLDAGIVSLKPGADATVLLNVKSTVTNSQTGKPETRLYHWRTNLVYSDGKWLVTKLEYL